MLSDKMSLELCLILECRAAEVAEEESALRLRISVLPIEAIFHTARLSAMVSLKQSWLFKVPVAVHALMAVAFYCQDKL